MQKTTRVNISFDVEAYNILKTVRSQHRSKFICDLIKSKKDRKKMLQQQKKDLIAQANWIQQLINDLEEVK